MPLSGQADNSIREVLSAHFSGNRRIAKNTGEATGYPRSMTQVDVSLTDYGLAAECLCFSWLFAPLRKSASPLPRAFMAFFFSIALAAAAGGTVHGFFLDESSLGYRLLWPFTLIVMGITGWSGVYIGALLQFTNAAVLRIDRAAMAVFVAYFLVVLFVRRDFLVAILDYLPALIFVGAAFLLAYRRTGRLASLAGFLGICTILFAALAQQAKLGIHPRYFNYNAVYHVLQAVALWMLFIAGKASVSAGS
jgi:hypothetical protein